MIQLASSERLPAEAVVVDKRRRFEMVKRRPRWYRPAKMVMADVEVSDESRRRYGFRNPAFQIIIR